MEIEELISLFQHQILDLPKLTFLHKTLKAAKLTMTNRVVLNLTNTELLATNTQKKRRVQRTGIQYDSQGVRVLGLEEVKKRKQLVENKKKDKEAQKLAPKERQANRYFFQVSKNLIRLAPDLIYRPNPPISLKNTKNPGSSSRNKKCEDQALINAFQDLLRIEPDVFEELVLDDLVSNTPIQNKRKIPPRRKNITGLVQVGLETIEEKREKEVWEVWISSRGRIICNTRKM